MNEANVFDAIRRNIDTVAKMEEKYLTSRGFAERLTDYIAAFSGSLTFVALHVVVFGLWILVNLRIISYLPSFDPYPFMLLNMIVSLEAILLSTFVLMKQNRMSRRVDARGHLDLQINLLAEKEMTMVLQMLRDIGAKVGVSDETLHPELEQLAGETPVEMLADEIEEKLS